MVSFLSSIRNHESKKIFRFMFKLKMSKKSFLDYNHFYSESQNIISGFDIAVFVLDSPFQLNNNVRPARLYLPTINLNVGLTAAGFGQINPSTSTTVLKMVILNLLFNLRDSSEHLFLLYIYLLNSEFTFLSTQCIKRFWPRF